MTEEQITMVAMAIKEAAASFQSPVRFYVEREAIHRFERDNPDKDAYIDKPGTDWELESWRILARAALSVDTRFSLTAEETERANKAPAALALAAELSREGWAGCKENGDVENCLTRRCPCGEEAMKRAVIGKG
jgi:hypothetical protein